MPRVQDVEDWLHLMRNEVGPRVEQRRELGRSSWFSLPCTCHATGECAVCKKWAARLKEIDDMGWLPMEPNVPRESIDSPDRMFA